MIKIRIQKSIGQRLIASLLLVILLMSAATVALVGVIANRAVEADQRRDYQRTAQVSSEYFRSRQRRLATGLESLVDSPETKSLLTMRGIDHATLLHSVTELQMVLEADVVLYANKKGVLLARTDDAFAEGDDLTDNPLVTHAIDGEAVVGVWDIDGTPHVTCAYPIEVAGASKGCMLAGYAVTSAFAGELKALTLRDMAVVYGDELIASTLPEADGETFALWLADRFAEESPEADRAETGATLVESTAGRAQRSTLRLPESGQLNAQSHELTFPIATSDARLSLISLLPRKELYASRDQMYGALAVLVALTVFGGGLLIVLIVRGVSRRVKATVGLLERVADGDYTQRLAFKGDDEFGRIARAANSAIEALSHTLEEVRLASEREKQLEAERLAAIEHKAEQERELQRQRDAQTETEKRQQEALRQQQLQAAEQRAQQAQHQQQREQELAEEQRQVAAVVEQRMNELLSRMEESSSSLMAAHKMSSEIDRVVDIMSELSAEARIVSLNAGIEATQVGELGAGFSAVAKEMTRLSERSQKATREISAMINETQAGITNCSSLAERTSESLRRVADETNCLLNKMHAGSAGQVDSADADSDTNQSRNQEATAT
ncbi:Methyl-accepting chemotaxis protein 4 [Posidoniimonas corsicana]|uniref:Methyl-accepting chemotaxis protein 4 n=1 Tax=Posidoniimonas corsicana TaxID=1938618 RepID=A0A5C5VFA7_9BACT|nr:methyl-accepting chemotaxis protein [Posidoniimonas corsicana]TWT36559.1 Methyl-accepting chemotaxis protein 4 [Posidoniimonas corsicana]